MSQMLIASTSLLWLIVLGNVFVTLAVVRSLNRLGTQGASLAQGLERGAVAPALSARTLTSDEVTLEEFRQGSVIVLFVSPTCGICRKSMGDYERIASSATAKGVNWIVVSDGSQEATKNMVDESQYQHPVLVVPRAENPAFDDWKIRMTPYFVHIEDGHIQSLGVGHYGAAEFTKLVKGLDLEPRPMSVN
jgi:peroxiredoxin